MVVSSLKCSLRMSDSIGCDTQLRSDQKRGGESIAQWYRPILWYQFSAQGWQTTIHPEDLPKLLERWRSLGTSE